MLHRLGTVVLILAVALGLAGCPKSQTGKLTQTGEVSRLFVDSAMDEVVRMYCVDGKTYPVTATSKGCTPRISEASYTAALSAYGKAQVAQKSYADAVILWDRVKNAANDQKVQAAFKDVRTQLDNAADIICAFKASNATLIQMCQTVGR